MSPHENDLRVVSFGYGHGPLPAEVTGADLIVDVRDWFRDPHVDPAMRQLTGRDRTVVDNVLATTGVPEFVHGLHLAVTALLALRVRRVTFAVGCVGGKHRSVVIADRLVELAVADGWAAEAEHLHVDRPVLQRR